MASWGITSESQARAQAAYDRKNPVDPEPEIYAGYYQAADQGRDCKN